MSELFDHANCWISVKHYLPENDRKVVRIILRNANGKQCFAHWIPSKKLFRLCDGLNRPVDSYVTPLDVTHWGVHVTCGT